MVGRPVIDVGAFESEGEEVASPLSAVSFVATDDAELLDAADRVLLCVRKNPFRGLCPCSFDGVAPLPRTPWDLEPSSLSSKRMSSATKPIFGETPFRLSVTWA
jgi:hypothetical protein